MACTERWTFVRARVNSKLRCHTRNSKYFVLLSILTSGPAEARPKANNRTTLRLTDNTNAAELHSTDVRSPEPPLRR